MVTSGTDDPLAIGRGFVAAIGRQAWGELAAILDPAVQFRALIPGGLRSADDRAAAAGYLERWFGDADELLLQSSEVQQLRDRIHIAYRYRAHEDQWYIVEQHVFCTIREGQIARLELLCSGFIPELAQAPPG